MDEDNVSDLITSNYIRADELDEKVVLEFKIVDFVKREFVEKDGEIKKKGIVRFEDGRGVVLNQTRLNTLVEAWGLNYRNWLGKTVRIRRGKTMYSGKPVAAVELEAVLQPKIEAHPFQSDDSRASDRPKGSIKIQTGRQKVATDFYDDDPGIGWERDEEPGDGE